MTSGATTQCSRACAGHPKIGAKMAVDFGTSCWYKIEIEGSNKSLILLFLQLRTDNPFLGTTFAQAHDIPAAQEDFPSYGKDCPTGATGGVNDRGRPFARR
jgi:hypothetical protein